MQRTISILLLVLSGLLIGQLLNSSTTAEDKDDTKKDVRLFEMRIYTTHSDKLDDLHARFRDHTNKIFVKHGMQLVGYWTPEDEETRDNTLIYILAYPSLDARKLAWAAFVKDPDWQKAYRESRADGAIVKKVESRFMSATDYSPIK